MELYIILLLFFSSRLINHHQQEIKSMEICMKEKIPFFLIYSFDINRSPNHRRRPKRSSINNNSLLSTVTSVHELMSLIIHKGLQTFYSHFLINRFI